MSGDELDHFLTEAGRAAIDRFLAESPVDGDNFNVAEMLDKNLYDALARYDSQAQLARWLSLRFTGPRTEGRIAEQAVSEILSAFRHELAGASVSKNPDVLRMDLVGFSRGSAVLHFAPADGGGIGASPSAEKGQQALAPEVDQIDDALSVVTELHVAIEGGDNVQRFYGQDRLLRGFETLADVLDRHDLDMGIAWRGRTGRHRTSELTSRGREYARQFFARSETVSQMLVVGRIVELDISGSFDVKASPAANSPRYKIVTGDEASLLGLSLQLGESVQILVRRRVDRNKVGVTFGTRYEYLRKVENEELMV